MDYGALLLTTVFVFVVQKVCQSICDFFKSKKYKKQKGNNYVRR